MQFELESLFRDVEALQPYKLSTSFSNQDCLRMWDIWWFGLNEKEGTRMTKTEYDICPGTIPPKSTSFWNYYMIRSIDGRS